MTCARNTGPTKSYCFSVVLGALLLCARQGFGADKETIDQPYSSIVGLNDHVSRIIKSLDQIERDKREKLLESLKARVGSAYFSRLSFVDGQVVDLAKAKTDPEMISMQRNLFAYRLSFRLSEPSAGINSYIGAVEFRGDGKIMKAEFPDIQHFPNLADFASTKCAFGRAAQVGMAPDYIEMRYDKDRDLITYSLKEWSPQRCAGKDMTVNAHTCAILNLDEEVPPYPHAKCDR